jgi:hypothetical protein
MSLFHGISGNGNNFVTEKECYNTCSGENPLVSTVQYRTFDEDYSGIYLALCREGYFLLPFNE